MPDHDGYSTDPAYDLSDPSPPPLPTDVFRGDGGSSIAETDPERWAGTGANAAAFDENDDERMPGAAAAAASSFDSSSAFDAGGAVSGGRGGV